MRVHWEFQVARGGRARWRRPRDGALGAIPALSSPLVPDLRLLRGQKSAGRAMGWLPLELFSLFRNRGPGNTRFYSCRVRSPR